MPQSLSNVLIHLVFSTKDRAPLIDHAIRAELYPYLTGTLRNHQSNVLQVGGVEDHVHILASLPRTMTIAQMAEKVKSGSSKWISEKWAREFAWQAGYGAFSVGIREVEQMTTYIRNQEEHHRKVSFQDELRALLREAGVEFDERYLFD